MEKREQVLFLQAEVGVTEQKEQWEMPLHLSPKMKKVIKGQRIASSI